MFYEFSLKSLLLQGLVESFWKNVEFIHSLHIIFSEFLHYHFWIFFNKFSLKFHWNHYYYSTGIDGFFRNYSPGKSSHLVLFRILKCRFLIFFLMNFHQIFSLIHIVSLDSFETSSMHWQSKNLRLSSIFLRDIEHRVSDVESALRCFGVSAVAVQSRLQMLFTTVWQIFNPSKPIHGSKFKGFPSFWKPGYWLVRKSFRSITITNWRW